jgi:hypothetical protein
MPTHENAPAAGDRPGRERGVLGERPQSTATAGRVPIGSYAWRRARGLETWRDLSRRWRAVRFVRPGAMVPLPEDLIGRRCAT